MNKASYSTFWILILCMVAFSVTGCGKDEDAINHSTSTVPVGVKCEIVLRGDIVAGLDRMITAHATSENMNGSKDSVWGRVHEVNKDWIAVSLADIKVEVNGNGTRTFGDAGRLQGLTGGLGAGAADVPSNRLAHRPDFGPAQRRSPAKVGFFKIEEEAGVEATQPLKQIAADQHHRPAHPRGLKGFFAGFNGPALRHGPAQAQFRLQKGKRRGPQAGGLQAFFTFDDGGGNNARPLMGCHEINQGLQGGGIHHRVRIENKNIGGGEIPTTEITPPAVAQVVRAANQLHPGIIGADQGGGIVSTGVIHHHATDQPGLIRFLQGG